MVEKILEQENYVPLATSQTELFWDGCFTGYVSETICVHIHEVPTWKRGYKVVTRRNMAVRSKYSELPGIVSSFKPQCLIILPFNGEYTQLILRLHNYWSISTFFSTFRTISQTFMKHLMLWKSQNKTETLRSVCTVTCCLTKRRL